MAASFVLLFIAIFGFMLFMGREDPHSRRRRYYRANRYSNIDDYIPRSYYDDDDGYRHPGYFEESNYPNPYQQDYYPQRYNDSRYHPSSYHPPQAYGPPQPYGYHQQPYAAPYQNSDNGMRTIVGILAILLLIVGAYGIFGKKESGTVININLRPEDVPTLKNILEQSGQKAEIRLDSDMPERKLESPRAGSTEGNGKNIYGKKDQLEYEQEPKPRSRN